MSTLRVNNISDFSGGTSNLNIPGTAKAWVNFNGVTTAIIRASLNVSSVTRNGTGDYTVSFTTPMVDENYSIIMSVQYSAAVGATFENILGANTNAFGTRVQMYQNGVTSDGAGYVYMAIFR